MARVHARRRGSSRSRAPPREEAPEWQPLEKQEIIDQIVKLAREGRTGAYIGLVLRDQYGVPNVKLATGKTTRLWRSQAPHYEYVVAVLDPDARRVITRRESVTEAPNYFLRDLRANRVTALTEFKDPAPQFAGITRKVRFHDLRHTYGSSLASEGLSLAIISKVMGHADHYYCYWSNCGGGFHRLS